MGPHLDRVKQRRHGLAVNFGVKSSHKPRQTSTSGYNINSKLWLEKRL
jgi:hypothetical protein